MPKLTKSGSEESVFGGINPTLFLETSLSAPNVIVKIYWRE